MSALNLKNLLNGTAWIIKQHEKTNHLYDGYLPYEFHLRQTVAAFFKHNHLLVGFTDKEKDNIMLACWGHDLIEDTRTTYNDCVENLGKEVADIIYAVTNEKGKNRAERANDKYYAGIIECPGAPFVKLCDRIANVKYSAFSQSGMLDLYRKEHFDFHQKMCPYDSVYQEMFLEIVGYFK